MTTNERDVIILQSIIKWIENMKINYTVHKRIDCIYARENNMIQESYRA